LVNVRVGKDKGIGEFTCLSGKNPSLIDYILGDGCFLSCCADFEALEIVGSDHLPLLLEVRVEDHQRKNKVIEKVS
jgi:endonuclease/exonuclease/phosphatase (EEP) superfamily protein YafD